MAGETLWLNMLYNPSIIRATSVICYKIGIYLIFHCYPVCRSAGVPGAMASETQTMWLNDSDPDFLPDGEEDDESFNPIGQYQNESCIMLVLNFKILITC